LDKTRLLALIPRLAGRRIVVVGDLFLDEYLVGKATRLSREAPIPVLEFVRREQRPGGAANPAHNIAALGGLAEVVGVIGDDEAGRQLLGLLQQIGVGTGGVVVDGQRPTTTKLRIMAEGSLLFPQQLARVDRLDRRPIASQIEEGIIAALRRAVPTADALLISDYKSGVISPAVLAECRELARRHGVLATVDSQGELDKFAGFTLVRANQADTAASLRRRLQSEDDFRQAGEQLLAELEAEAVLIGRGAEGMSLASRQGYVHIPAANRSEVYDVTGAGDTVIAVVTLALAAGASPLEAAELANVAAGLVVRKLGNAVTTPVELTQAVQALAEPASRSLTN
jgi:rfaE bifunctional protein kinase chain/domain